MSVTVEYGDIFESKAEALVNPVNVVGICGAGLALVFKRKYPVNYQHYRSACIAGGVAMGKVLIVEMHEPPLHYIINFPTKRAPSDRSCLGDVENGLCDLYTRAWYLGIKSIAMPALGCGLGGLDYERVEAAIKRQFEPGRVTVYLYGPIKT